MDWVLSFVEVIRSFGAPYINHHRKLEDYMNELRGNVNSLNSRKRDLELKMEAEDRCGKKMKKEVENWVKDVEKVGNEVKNIEEKFLSVSFWSRGHLGSLVCQNIEKVNKIYQQGSFSDGVAVDGPPQIGLPLSTTNPEGQIDVRTRIWEYLMGDGVPMIGVCGMGGIGKTTLMKHINDQLSKETEKFDIVMWITVSKESNIFKLQKDIAEFLKLQSLPDNELQRAARLKNYLEGRRYALILDDVWEQFSLLDVGIPDPTLSMGRKVVLTSRLADVCRCMDCVVVEVQPLSKNGSMNLFLNAVGLSVGQYQNLKDIIDKVVDQCRGLPLSIVTIAGSMKGVDDICEWRNALAELENRVKSVKEWDIKIFEQLKFSYDRLNDPNIKNCFLHCSLYPEDFVIARHGLIEDWIDEGLLGLGTKEAMHDRGQSILNKLEDFFLLERATSPSYGIHEGVKMHDVLRDMALYIAGHQFMVKAGMQLKELPSEQEWTVSVEKVSLMQNSKLIKIPPHISPKWPHLSTLILQNCGLKSIPESFFKHMAGLKVLDLSDNHFLEYLPNSISNLNTLNALILVGCWQLKYMPSLVELTALRKLNLLCTGIKKVPHGIEMLENLRDLRMQSTALKGVPVEILPRICHLQCLMIGKTLVKGEEVGQLRKLEWVSCSFSSMQEFKKYAECTQGQWPTSFTFQVGPLVDWDTNLLFSPNFKKIEKEVMFTDSEIGKCDDRVVPHDLRSLTIAKIDDFKCLNNMPLFRKATDLKKCQIRDCGRMKCVVDLSLSSCDILHDIEVLYLCRLRNLREVVRVGVRVAVENECTSHAPTPPAIFSSLRTLDLSCCSKIKKLFPVELLQGLQNLEEIKVFECEEMEEIIVASEENHKGEGTTFILPKLKKLLLIELPKLKSICSAGLMIPANSLQTLTIVRCPELKRIPLSLPLVENGKPSPPPSLQEIFVGPRARWESVEWDQPDAKDVVSPFVRYLI
ncbi:putative disease resistance protein At4g10780 isoform X1 [Herrania umbratica]|uniref:Disease resistance protein At4g10780 isoform X1 n=1 Tax=Herrania umbratica TaxID=108875 RepID=A0A6J1ANW5_9ROSI|nr:putative disease resistance protein At4g10780 isoform X1 [Herrania umbratica]XP_021288900.1 putative disease resistance protein At4g10780 isoform X1 [Herrania umbratica]XP_021288901.1 putative disease resistance protein At4g10780 isoform X1 [Herrania umbratica]XP_021288902.1 putative disease resistance protein At4g10780 isoform X1 [Herrania umbratica]XP_021288903.1 putative disease resistance protein At4g10780 isoform X1 [Herrania umbratica]XP_021288904.1 putative disease resistance protein